MQFIFFKISKDSLFSTILYTKFTCTVYLIHGSCCQSLNYVLEGFNQHFTKKMNDSSYKLPSSLAAFIGTNLCALCTCKIRVHYSFLTMTQKKLSICKRPHYHMVPLLSLSFTPVHPQLPFHFSLYVQSISEPLH